MITYLTLLRDKFYAGKPLIVPGFSEESVNLCAEALFRYISGIPRKPTRASAATLRRNRRMTNSAASNLFKQFVLLPLDEQLEFMEYLAGVTTGTIAQAFVDSLAESERYEFHQHEISLLRPLILPMFLDEAIDVVKDMPDAIRDALKEELQKRTDRTAEHYVKTITRYEIENQKKERNRKSKPETIRRNVEICDLRQKDWSQGRIAKKFKITPQSIRKIESQENKWRLLLAELSTK